MFGRNRHRFDGHEQLLAEGVACGLWPHRKETPAEFAFRVEFAKDMARAVYRLEVERIAERQ